MIRFEHFTKSFGAIVAVDDVTLMIDRGEVVALLGPNGSGKTTTFKGAAGLISPTSGEVMIGSQPAQNPAARNAISYLPQKVAFPETLTGREVVTFYQRLRAIEPSCVKNALHLTSLNGASDRPVATYSGGMLQRLGLAVAILPDAPIMLLDEPTAALDPDGLCAFYGLVEERQRAGKTLLFTSHQLGDAERLADRFAILIDGRLSAVMSRSELAEALAARGVMRLRVDREPAEALKQVRRLAPESVISGDELVVPGPASMRPRVIELVRNAGFEIRGLTAEESRLDAFYRTLVNQRQKAEGRGQKEERSEG